MKFCRNFFVGRIVNIGFVTNRYALMNNHIKQRNTAKNCEYSLQTLQKPSMPTLCSEFRFTAYNKLLRLVQQVRYFTFLYVILLLASRTRQYLLVLNLLFLRQSHCRRRRAYDFIAKQKNKIKIESTQYLHCNLKYVHLYRLHSH